MPEVDTYFLGCFSKHCCLLLCFIVHINAIWKTVERLMTPLLVTDGYDCGNNMLSHKMNIKHKHTSDAQGYFKWSFLFYLHFGFLAVCETSRERNPFSFRIWQDKYISAKLYQELPLDNFFSVVQSLMHSASLVVVGGGGHNEER